MLGRRAALRFVPCLLALTCVTVAHRPSFASTTRVASLGAHADMLDDVVNVFDYPALMVRYGNTALADLGRVTHPDDFTNSGELDFTGRSVGGLVSYPRAEQWGVFGLVFGREVPDQTAPDPLPSPGDGVELLYGHGIGSRAQVGLRGFFAARGNEFHEFDTPRSVRSDASMARILLGLGWDASARVRVDVAGGLGDRAFSVDSVYANGKRSSALENAGGSPWSARGRVAAELADDLGLHLYAGYAHDDFGYEAVIHSPTLDSVSAVETVEAPAHRTEIGAAFTLTPNEEFAMFLGLAFEEERRESRRVVNGVQVADSPRTTRRAPVLVGGAEMSPWTWLAFRLSAQKAYTVDERDSVNADPYSGFAPQHVRERSFPTTFSMGARVSVRRLDADILFNDRTPFVQGFYASGAPVVPITSISVTYWFGGDRRRSSRRG